ncbi:MAG TPA: hypothetical protein VFD38_08040 [Myxococcaceae bacterium]|nr:hypothetical protein [Myxococcaceae bacterium]
MHDNRIASPSGRLLSSLYLHSEGAGPKLRVGVLLDGEALPRHFAAVLEDIRACDFAELALLVLNLEERAQPRTARLSRPRAIWRRLTDEGLRSRLAYDLYERLDARRKPEEDPEEPVDCASLLAGVDRLDVQPIRKGFVHRFPEEALERIRAARLDVILRFGFNIVRGGILEAARHGVWSYHHGDNERFRGGPPEFWEVVERAQTSGVLLQKLSDELDGGFVLCKSTFATTESLFVSANRELPYWGGVHFVIRKLRELHAQGWETVRARAVPPAPYIGRRRIYRRPTNAEMVGWLSPRLAVKAARRSFRKPTLVHWRVALRTGARLTLDRPEAEPTMDGFRLLEPPPGHYWADPALVEHAGRTWLFFEDWIYAERRGVIGVAEVLGDGTLGPHETCLDTGRHLSYPHVFRHAGEHFMIPESGADHEVVLYRATDFPRRWKREHVLQRGLFAVDTTAFEHDGRWWFFPTVGERSGGEVELLLFSSHSLTGEWTAHPANPICSDVLRSRGAGAILEQDGRLVRPSQSCAPVYGHSLLLNEIIQLNPREYAEQTVRTIRPTWAPGLIGTHTYNRAGHHEVVDACDLIDAREALRTG